MTANADHQDITERVRARLLAGLLLLAGVLVGVCPLIGVVTTADGSPTGAVTLAAFTAVLPGVLAVALAFTRPVLGLAATAGAGLIGLARLCADLALLTETDGVTRPELFYETTDRARPFATTGGVWLLLAADLLMVVVGVLAAGRLARDGGEDSGVGPEPLFGSACPGPGDRRAGPVAAGGHHRRRSGTAGGSLGARAERAAGWTPRPEPADDRGRLPGAILLMVGALETPYSGGYLDAAGAAARGEPERCDGRCAASRCSPLSALYAAPCLDRRRRAAGRHRAGGRRSAA